MADDDEEYRGFFWTCRSALTAPRAFFSRPAPARSRWGPLAFTMAVSAIALPIATLLGALFPGGSIGVAYPAAIKLLVLGPLAAVLSAFFIAALTHFWLIVVRARSRPFGETLACVCYASAAMLLGVVPILGAAIGSVWYPVVLAIGLKHAHKTTRPRAIFAVIAGPLLVMVALGLRSGVIEAFKIPSGAMIPTLMIGDHFFVSKLAYGPLIPGSDKRLFSRLPPSRADVMVFKFPENKEQDFIKRAIAIPGDRLEAINGRPIINGWLVPHCHVGPFKTENHTAELYIEFLEDKSYFTLFEANPDEPCNNDCNAAGLVCKSGICGIHQGPFEVAQEEAWVMGDNRNNSHDSRSWNGGRGGGVPFENIKGRAMFVWMSFGPGGSIAKDRLWVELHGPPTLPAGQDPTLQTAIDRCLKERPPITATTPPLPGGPPAR